MAGRHAPAAAGAPQAPRQKRRSRSSFRKFLVSAGATLVAFSIAAAMAIPAAASISTTANVTPSLSIGQQKMSVSQKAVLQTVTRDSFSIGHQYKDGGPAIGSVNGWAAPTTLRINSPWGPRQVICTSGVGCDSGFHQGDDFAGACGTPFYAASGGTVTSITYGGLAGDEIVIDYGQDGISTAYSHMYNSGIFVQLGQKVLAGENIGAMGSTGDSTGCHLYFEYRINHVPVDPVPALESHGIQLTE